MTHLGSFTNLLINGFSTGMLIFLLAVGLSLVFGLMDVLNFAHGGLFAWGAFFGVWLYSQTGLFWLGLLGAIMIGAVLGVLMERYIIKPVYGNHIQQILITLGVMLVLSELLKVVWGPNPIAAPTPKWLAGSWSFGTIILIKYRLFVIALGILVFIGVIYLMNRTRIGLIIRAGVMDKEMVQALGINVQQIFLFTFVLGSSLAALGGMLMGPYSGVVFSDMGSQYNILAFIVVVIGGMGSVSGTLFAALLVSILGSFMSYYVPDLSLAVNMLIMALVLLFKPSGLFKVGGAS